MNEPPEAYELASIDGRTYPITVDALRRAAMSLPPSSGMMFEVLLDGKRIELLPVLEKILSAEQGTISARVGIEVANVLGLEIYRDQPAKEPARPQNLRSDLARLAGHWVALQGGQILGASLDLAELMVKVHSSEASILFIPERKQ
ncbi:hypothetical protein [Microbacterium sp. RURRCA19A]|uniref:hypothetical protein n=1 Tax=Microbacterium sp. RURRCA19A TaxID=1907391 RepID=UPI0011158884|nr:hypothetical protein [Microbacterium sp. RURRCA19A]